MKKTQFSFRFLFRLIVLLVGLAAIPLTVFLVNKKMGPERRVASDSLQEVGLSVSADQKAIKYKLLASAAKHSSTEGSSIHLGLPRLITDEGNDATLCEEYPTIDWILSAEGVAIAGEIPQIVVRAPCFSDDQNEVVIAPPISLKKIFKATPQGLKGIQFKWKKNPEGFQVFLRNALPPLPEEWVWTGLRLYGKDRQSSISIDGYEILSVIGEPIILNINE